MFAEAGSVGSPAGPLAVVEPAGREPVGVRFFSASSATEWRTNLTRVVELRSR
jgi:hypothetical protein